MFRSLQIRGNFDVCLVISDFVLVLRGYDAEKVQQELLGLWLPDTLRQSAMTEESVYRLSRA